MKRNHQNIIRTFKMYGFDYKREFSNEQNLVFAIRQAFFLNAAIVTSDISSSQKVEENLKKLGYAVNTHKFISMEDIESNLFDAFFSIKITKQSFLNDYQSYTERVLKSFPVEATQYQYIAAPFSKNTETEEQQTKVTKDITNELATEGPKLILIEAAAGFGKTSTAYEIGREISINEKGILVLFAELSRDRQAKVFKHVLYHELDRSFPALPSELVIDSIQKGKIIVILDGFDELLKSTEEENQFEKSEAMLETIGEILKNKAKVILTTRKTAVLQGDEFHNWTESHDKDFSVIRYALREPKITDWLPVNKIRTLEECGIDIKNIANPVLLTYLNYLPESSFSEISEDPDIIVEKYFTSMLERENERQELRMSPDDQVKLLTRLSEDMIRRNYTKDTRENIIKYFLANELEIIESLRQSYPAPSRPTKEELANRFSNHALLDRSTSDEKIGFINDFALGNFVANSALNSKEPEWAADEIFVEAAVSAYSPRKIKTKESLWEKLSYSLQFIKEEDQIKLETALLERADTNIVGANINNMMLDRISLFENNKATDCVFYECTFKDCTFNLDNIQNNTFVCCTFYNCAPSGKQNNNKFISCNEQGGKISEPNHLKATQKESLTPAKETATEYILEKFWPRGKDSITFAHRPLSLFFGKNNLDLDPEEIESAIDTLKRSGLIIEAKKKNWIGIDTSRLSEISKTLGRQQ